MAAVSSASGSGNWRMHAADLNGPTLDELHYHNPNLEQQQQRERRPSPSYEQGVAPSREARRQTPERALGHGYENHGANGYGGQRGRGNPYMGNGNNRGDYFTERRAQREASTLSIWPASPRTPRDDSDDSDAERSRKKRKKDKKDKKHSSSSKSKKRSSKRYDSDDSDTDSEEEERRRRKKKSKRREAESDEEYERRKRKKEKRSRRDRSYSRSKSPVDRVRNEQEDEEEQWAEKGATSSKKNGDAVGDARLAVATAPADKSGLTSSKGKGKENIAGSGSESDDDDDVGPKPLPVSSEKVDSREFGGALLRGEGQAMAAFVSEGQRIPRRGEIGMESAEIEKFEASGYVMSGSRHRRMNAVRIRKENQVISAEEKRGILKLQKEEKDRKEAMIVGSFKELVERRLEGERKLSEKNKQGRGRDEDDY